MKSSEKVNIEAAAAEFASKLPSEVFTAAVIQNFLIVTRRPEVALAKVEDWKAQKLRKPQSNSRAN